jgi:hypothetical protein
MIESKYIIIISVIVCLLVLYYFYDEISSMKKLFLPTYQKTMTLEAKIAELEKKITEPIPPLPSPNKKPIKKNDSPALSITYHSDMVKNGNSNVRYVDLSDTEGIELLKKIEESKKNPSKAISNKNNVIKSDEQINNKLDGIRNKLHNTPIPSKPLNQPVNAKQQNIQYGELSDIPVTSEKNLNQNMLDEDTDSFNVNIDGIIGTGTKDDDYENDYQNILNGLSIDFTGIVNKSGIRSKQSDETSSSHSKSKLKSVVDDNDNELDLDMIRSISESVQFADMPSNDVLSDIPRTKPKTIPKTKLISGKINGINQPSGKINGINQPSGKINGINQPSGKIQKKKHI